MFTKQVSVFVENRKGRLAEVTKLLADEHINVRSVSLADMSDLGVLRIIVDDRPRCVEALKRNGFMIQETDVIAVEMEDRPGGLHRVVAALAIEDVNIEYMYTTLEKGTDKAIVILRVDDRELAMDVLKRHGIAVLPGDSMQKL